MTPVTLTLLNTASTQNFNILASTGTSNVLPQGWVMSERDTAQNTTYTAGTGSDNTGDTYSFGSTGSTDRAFGTLFSGSLASTIGAVFTNLTGSVITSFTISFTGEQWRLGTTGRADTLLFAYNPNVTVTGNAAILTTGAFTNVSALDFNSPNTTTTGALDGNATANRTLITATITGLNIGAGQSFAIRWTDTDASGADDGLAIDDFSLTANPVPEPTTWVAGALLLGAVGWHQRRRIAGLGRRIESV